MGRGGGEFRGGGGVIRWGGEKVGRWGGGEGGELKYLHTDLRTDPLTKRVVEDLSPLKTYILNGHVCI